MANVKSLDGEAAPIVVSRVEERVRAARPNCRLRLSELEEYDAPEGVVRIARFECETHGATWGEFVGGTTKLSCRTRASASLMAAQGSPQEAPEEPCSDDDDVSLADLDV